MRIITLHCDYIRFKALKKALKDAEELKEKGEKEVKEPLVVLTAVEKGDGKEQVKEMVEAVKKTAKEVNVKDIVLYPYSHLSSNLASPDLAMNLLIEAEKELKKDFKVERAPFGYYKEFELKVKGHPLSELSKEFYGGSASGQCVNYDNERYDCGKLLQEISKSKLDTRKLKDNDHRIIGQHLDLFSFNEVAPGMVFWHNKGWIIFNELINFWREEHRKAGYEEISTPQILDKKLWQISGHWEKYRNNIFLTEYEGKDLAVKPMNCPGGMMVYKSSPKSYKDLPLRVGELGIVHRQELSGVLGGLFRVVRFTQDDAHIFCTEKQINQEVMGIVKLIDLFYKKFKLSYHVEFSTRPEKRIGTDKEWDLAEKLLGDVLKKNKIKYKVNEGDGAFYGPKVDFHVKDSLGRTWQTATIQLDMLFPERFDLNYTGEDNKQHRPIILHRTVLGSFERFIGILLEHLNGNLPVWLSPIQARVISFTDRNVKAVEKLVKEMREEGIRVDSDIRNTTVNEKVHDAEVMRIPYMIVIGDKEEKGKNLAVRERGKKKIDFEVKKEKFISELKEKIARRI